MIDRAGGGDTRAPRAARVRPARSLAAGRAASVTGSAALRCSAPPARRFACPSGDSSGAAGRAAGHPARLASPPPCRPPAPRLASPCQPRGSGRAPSPAAFVCRPGLRRGRLAAAAGRPASPHSLTSGPSQSAGRPAARLCRPPPISEPRSSNQSETTTLSRTPLPPPTPPPFPAPCAGSRGPGNRRVGCESRRGSRGAERLGEGGWGVERVAVATDQPIGFGGGSAAAAAAGACAAPGRVRGRRRGGCEEVPGPPVAAAAGGAGVPELGLTGEPRSRSACASPAPACSGGGGGPACRPRRGGGRCAPGGPFAPRLLQAAARFPGQRVRSRRCERWDGRRVVPLASGAGAVPCLWYCSSERYGMA